MPTRHSSASTRPPSRRPRYSPCFLSPFPLLCPLPRFSISRSCPKHQLSPAYPLRPSTRTLPCASASNPSVFDQIKHQIPLSRAFSDLLGPSALVRSGPTDFKACCPFHADRSPSLHIYSAQNRFHCFGCGAGGSIIDFETLRTGDSSVSNALRSLAARYPQVARLITTTPQNAPTATAEQPQEGTPVRKQWRAIVARTSIAREVQRTCAQLYEKALWQEHAVEARRYMTEVRGLSEETLKLYGCGYAPGRGDWMVRSLEDLGHPKEHAVIGGVARRGKEKSDVIYDIFRDRVVTPIRNIQGETIAQAGRIVGDAQRAAWVPKYVNGPETEIFKKRDALFGIDIAKMAPSVKVEWEDKERGVGKLGFVLMVEGYMDVMTVYEHTNGYAACVATMGTSMSAKQLEAAYDLLEDPMDGKVIINFDTDDAGIAAAERLCDSVIPESECAHVVYIATLPPDIKDPDEFLSAHGSGEDYIDYVQEVALPWYDWRARRIIIEEQLSSDESAAEEGDSDSDVGKSPEREMVDLDSSDQSFDFQLGEIMKKRADELLVAFGGPPELMDKKENEDAMPSISKDVVESLAQILESAQRSIPGLNSGAVVHAWSDSLCRSHVLALSPLYRKILTRAEQLSSSWVKMSPAAQVKWMSPPPWIVEDITGTRRRNIRKNAGQTADGLEMDWETFSTDKRRVEKSISRLKAQEAHFLPYIEKEQSDDVKMLRVAPRRAAEEAVLRCLIFASEMDRLDALEKLLEVMIWCEQRDLPFWTSKARESLFDYLGEVDGPVTRAEMAAYLEDEEWWGTDIEALFFPSEGKDIALDALRALERANPVAVVEATARGVAEMAGKVASGLALKETGDIAKKMLDKADRGEQDEMDELLARQISLKKAVSKMKYLNPEDEVRFKEEAKKQEEEMERERRIKETLKLLETLSVPYPGEDKGGKVSGEKAPASGDDESRGEK